MRLGIISDTHGLLRPEAVACLRGADLILHAGDVGAPDILERLAELAPVAAIRGNVDHGAWAAALPPERRLDLCGHRVHMIHDIGDLREDPAAAGFALIICGHTHRTKIDRLGPAMLLNPGSAGPRRFRLPVTLATLDLRAGALGTPVIHRLVEP